MALGVRNELARELMNKLGSWDEGGIERGAESGSYDALYSPLRCGMLTLKNRIISFENDCSSALTISPIDTSNGFDSLCSVRNSIEKAHENGSFVFAEFKSAGKRAVCEFAASFKVHGFDGVYMRDVPLTDVKKLRAQLGFDYPFFYHIGIDGGCAFSETLEYIRRLIDAGIDMLAVSLGTSQTPWLYEPSELLPEGFALAVSAFIKKHFAETSVRSLMGTELPVVYFGRLYRKGAMNGAVRDKLCDAVLLERGCAADDFSAQYRGRLPKRSTKATVFKRIAVVGGGENGLLFALAAARRGHNVTLYEENSVLGGRQRLSADMPLHYALNEYLSELIQLSTENENICIKHSTRADTDMLKKYGYDAIVYADGCRSVMPNIPGWGSIRFITAQQAVQSEISPAERIVIIGSDSLAQDCAWKNRKCRKLTVLGELGDGFCKHYIEQSGGRIIADAKPLKIADKGLYYEADGKKRFVRSTLIIVCGDGVPNTVPYKTAFAENAAEEIYRIDSIETAKALAEYI